MKREILIATDTNEKQVAILEDGRLEEYYIERTLHKQMFGNIYKGVVKTVIPGMGAAFVNLGSAKDGFLYVADAMESPLDLDAEFDDAPNEQQQQAAKRGHRPNIQDVLKVGQEVIVQVVKEPLGNKGPRLTTHFSIPARYLVMMPGQEKIGLSRRIDDKKERDRIRQILRSAEIPKGIGFIVRTAAEGKSDKEFTRDIRYLIRLWRRIHGSIDHKKAPSMIHQELNLVERVIRDHMTEETDRIVLDDRDTLRKVKRFLNLYMPGQNIHIDLHQGDSLFDHCNISKDIAKTFQRVCPLKSGGHIVIEQTESLVAIDVNTGKFTGRHNLEETVFKTNLEAAEEVSRQLRLRDVGGIIVVDFIDMERYEHRRQLFRAFCDFVKKDRAKTNILKVSELGLVEMTRQRMRPSLESAVYDSCDYCDGRGTVKSSTTMAIQTVRELRKALGESHGRVVNAYVHPQVAEKVLSLERKSLHQLERRQHSRIFVFSEPANHMEDVNITFVK